MPSQSENIYLTRTYISRCSDLIPLSCNRQDCRPSYSYGPAIRDYWVVHFVSKGLGRFTLQDKTYTVREGEFFYIPPDTLAYYEADAEDPWSYAWVGMAGTIMPKFFERLGISAENPIGKFTPELYELARGIFKSREEKNTDSLSAVGRLYLFLDCFERLLATPKITQKQSSEYVELAISIIEGQIHKPISVAGLAEKIGIDRSYLCNIFKKELKCSPQSYILERKMDRAKHFLSSTSENVKYIALSLGYEDQFVFSRAFKSRTGMSPSQWRETHSTKKDHDG